MVYLLDHGKRLRDPFWIGTRPIQKTASVQAPSKCRLSMGGHKRGRSQLIFLKTAPHAGADFYNALLPANASLSVT